MGNVKRNVRNRLIEYEKRGRKKERERERERESRENRPGLELATSCAAGIGLRADGRKGAPR